MKVIGLGKNRTYIMEMSAEEIYNLMPYPAGFPGCGPIDVGMNIEVPKTYDIERVKALLDRTLKELGEAKMEKSEMNLSEELYLQGARRKELGRRKI